MKRLLPCALALIFLHGCDGPAPSDAPQERPFERPSPAELVVDLVDGSGLEALLARFPSLKPEDARWNSPHSIDEAVAVLRVPAAQQTALLEKLRADPQVEFAENNALLRLPIRPAGPADTRGMNLPDDDSHPARAGFPNDPLYERQWNMELVRARGAWRYASGEDVIVAVIDTGVAYESEKGLSAPDLEQTRFVPGWDFIGDDPIAADDNGHGTHCAGTIAQSTNNKRGVIGLAPGCKVMPIKVLTAQGFGSISDIVDGIRFAADHGAHVISMSLGGGGYSRVMNSAVEYARSKGVAVVCAAGNGGRAVVEYPAAYPDSIAVSSVGPSGKLAFYSSYGKQVFLAAPGGDMREGVEAGVLQNTLDRADRSKTVYAYYQGTSMATPHVAAACALLHEAGVTRVDAKKRILAATASGSGWNNKLGNGVLDAGAAVRHAIFVPGGLALLLGLVLGGLVIKRTRPRELSRGLLAAGVLAGACGLFFLRPLGLGEVPLLGPYLTRGLADWDIALLGASSHWNALWASALIPAFLGLISIPSTTTRSLGIGLALGWAARLFGGAILPYADVRWIPGQGLLDGLWLVGNGAVLLAAVAVFIRLGRSRARA